MQTVEQQQNINGSWTHRVAVEAFLKRVIDYDALEVFDFDRQWASVKPFLHEPETEALLDKCMNAFIALRNIYRQRGELKYFGAIGAYEPKKGPWLYSPTYYWIERREMRMEQLIDAGDFESLADDATAEQEGAYWDRYDLVADEFYPKPDSYEWYQVLDASHWLAPWLCALAARVLPQWEWKILEGEKYSLVYGCDTDGKIRVLFDILKFKEMSAKQLIELATAD